jgi:hypothetical protein
MTLQMTCAKRAGLALAAALAGLAPATAGAAFYTGDELYRVCTAAKGDKAYIEQTYECIAYITGAVDAFSTARRVTKVRSCIPEGVTISRLRGATMAFLEENPKLRSEPASDLVFAATRKQWPCPKAAKKR